MDKEDLKEINGTFRRLTRSKEGNLGIETVTLVKGKVTEFAEVEPNYPSVAMHQYQTISVQTAMRDYDLSTQVKATNA